MKHKVRIHAVYEYEIDDEDLSGYDNAKTVAEAMEQDKVNVVEEGLVFEEIGFLESVKFELVEPSPQIRYCNNDGCIHQFAGPHGIDYHNAVSPDVSRS